MGHTPCFRVLGLFGTNAFLTALAGAHLAHALSLRGTPLWLVDEALAPHNATTCLGVVARTSLDQALRREGPTVQALMEAAPGLNCLPIHGGLPWLAGVPEQRWRAAVADLTTWPSQPEYLLLLSPPTREAVSLALFAPERLLVLPQGRQDLTRAYALLKAVQRSHPSERWQVLVMQAADDKAARTTFTALQGTAQRFLGLRLRWLGSVPSDPALTEAMRHLRQVREIPAERPAMQAFRRLAEVLVHTAEASSLYPPQEFWLRMWIFSRLRAEMSLERERDAQIS